MEMDGILGSRGRGVVRRLGRGLRCWKRIKMGTLGRRSGSSWLVLIGRSTFFQLRLIRQVRVYQRATSKSL